MPRPTLASLLEDFRNWNKTQDWMLNKQRDIYGNEDPDTIALNEKLAGIGTADMGMLGSSVGGLAGMIKAYHGSPHAFERFDMSKIGSGEGAQAYGHGLYFAENPSVASEYQQALASKEGLTAKIGGKSITDFYNEIQRKADKLPYEKAASEYEKLSFLEDLDQQPTFQHALQRIDDESILPWAKALESKYQPAGSFYDVELKWPDAAREAADPLGEHHLLDWDAPLSEQPEGVRNALSDFVKNRKDAMNARQHIYTSPVDAIIKRQKGEDWYSDLSGAKGGDIAASNYLRDLGIPGIRYLDQGSRGTGTGTRNYVMFDDRIPNIVSRNGVSLTDLLRR